MSVHQEHSKADLTYFDPETNERYIPHVIEPSVGVERMLLAVLDDAYDEEELENGETREVLRIKPMLAPYKVAVLPLVNKLQDKAREVYSEVVKHFMANFDTSGNIGHRYRRQMQSNAFRVGDYETLEDGCDVRDRDT